MTTPKLNYNNHPEVARLRASISSDKLHAMARMIGMRKHTIRYATVDFGIKKNKRKLREVRRAIRYERINPETAKLRLVSA